MSDCLIRSFRVEDSGIRHLRIGDLNNDGYAELVRVQLYPQNREVCGITAIDLEGNVLWRHGEMFEGDSGAYSDAPVQVVDWDGDGHLEVVYIKQAYYKGVHMWSVAKGGYVDRQNATLEELRFDPDLRAESAFEYEGDAHLVVLDGATGVVKRELAIPAPADDCMAFGYFDGSGRLNVLVKDRYWNLWALSNDGEILWKITDKDLSADTGNYSALGHFPAVGDIDGDGLDEVFLTNALIDSDGTILWKIPGAYGHHDAAYILDDLPERRIVAVGDKLRMVSQDGKVLWERDGGHLQRLYVGRFSRDLKDGPYQFLTLDWAPCAANFEEGIPVLNGGLSVGQRASLFNWYGDRIWSEETDDRPVYGPINWTGDRDSIMRSIGGGDAIIMDSQGRVIDTIRFEAKEKTADKMVTGYCKNKRYYIADILGDSREELIIFDESTFNIHMNTEACSLRCHYNRSNYAGG